jgi:hypothetical protein
VRAEGTTLRFCRGLAPGLSPDHLILCVCHLAVGSATIREKDFVEVYLASSRALDDLHSAVHHGEPFRTFWTICSVKRACNSE